MGCGGRDRGTEDEEVEACIAGGDGGMNDAGTEGEVA